MKHEYHADSFFVSRTPLLALEAAAPSDCRSPSGLPEMRLARAIQALREPAIREAISIMSADLHAASARLHEGAMPQERSTVDACRATIRYVTRLATRATPFGVAAGYAVGTVGGDTSLSISPPEEWRRQCRLDTWAWRVVADRVRLSGAATHNVPLLRHPGVWSSRREVKLLLVRREGPRDEIETDLIVAENSAELACALDASHAPISQSALISKLCALGFGADEAEQYVAELTGLGVVAPVYDISRSSSDLLDELREWLEYAADPALADLRCALEKVDIARDAICRASDSEVARTAYEAGTSALCGLFPQLKPQDVYQIDLFRGHAGALSGTDARAVVDGAIALFRAQAIPADPLRHFKDCFRDRYDTQEVPLLLALDDEDGIAIPGLSLANRDVGQVAERLPPSGHNDFRLSGLERNGILQRALEAAAERAPELALEAAELQPPDGMSLPTAFCALAQLLDSNEARVYVHWLRGPSGAICAGRLAEDNQRLRSLLRVHHQQEEACEPDAIFAEVNVIPEHHDGNVLRRPPLRQFEIVYHSRSNVAKENVITVDDLLISVANDIVTLRSRRLGRRVIPRITSAYNPDKSGFGFVRFLAAVGSQRLATGVYWDWGPLESAPYLPRVRAGAAVLAPARWRIPVEELELLTVTSSAGRAQRLAMIRDRYSLPQNVGVVESIVDLPCRVDLSDPTTLDAFLAYARRNSSWITLVEALPLRPVVGPRGMPFSHELLLPIQRRAASAASSTRFQQHHPSTYHPPGSAWGYMKISCGPRESEVLLRDVIWPVVSESRRGRLLRCWFFVRMESDADMHMRIRYLGADSRAARTVTENLLRRLRVYQHEGDVSLHTYRPETTRLGGPEAVALAESLYEADSDAAVARLLSPHEISPTETAGLGMLTWLLDLDLDVGRSLQLLLAYDPWAEQHLALPRGGLGKLWRTVRPHYHSILAEDSVLMKLLERRSSRVQSLLRGVKVDDDLARTLLHLWCNRVFVSNQRAQEAVAADYMARLVRSEQKRRQIPDSARLSTVVKLGTRLSAATGEGR